MTFKASMSLACAVSALMVNACSRTDAATQAPPPPQVAFIELIPQTVPLETEWITTLDGYVNAQIRPQVSGYLIRRAYTEGSSVRRGQVLFEIDSRPFDAALAQARANVAQAQAELGRTTRDLDRDRPLAEQRAIARSQLDNDIQANLAAQAAVKAATAAVETAALNVEFTRVRSLINGIAAIATAQIGDLVGPSTLLTTVSQVDPIRAYFSMAEQDYLRIADLLNGGSRGRPWASGGLTLTLADGSTYPERGTFLVADRQIDPNTGTIRIGASFPNPRHVLRPGQYGRVTAITGSRPNALLVPQRAVVELQGTYEVRVLAPDDRVQVRRVSVAGRVDNQWIVEEGLQAGMRVVLDGGQLREGTVVTGVRSVEAAN